MKGKMRRGKRKRRKRKRRKRQGPKIVQEVIKRGC